MTQEAVKTRANRGAQVRSNRSNMNGDRGRGQHGNGFGAGNTNFHTIWSDTNRVHGFGEGMFQNARVPILFKA